MTNIPRLSSIDTAISTYYSCIALYTDNIRDLFNGISSSTVTKLKNLARKKMSENGHIPLNSKCVNTEDAYEAWGLDIEQLKAKNSELKRLQCEM